MIAVAENQFATGIVALFIGLLILSLAILWIIFPVLVLSRFSDLLKAQREIAKALQWMVNNWKDEDSKPPPPPPPPPV